MNGKEYIEREAFIIAKRKQYCADCDRRKGVKRGKTVFCYEIGDAPCRSCGIGDVLDDVEDFPAADVVEVRHSHWVYDGYGEFHCHACKTIWHITEGTIDDLAFCPNCGAKMDGEG